MQLVHNFVLAMELVEASSLRTQFSMLFVTLFTAISLKCQFEIANPWPTPDNLHGHPLGRLRSNCVHSG